MCLVRHIKILVRGREEAHEELDVLLDGPPEAGLERALRFYQRPHGAPQSLLRDAETHNVEAVKVHAEKVDPGEIPDGMVVRIHVRLRLPLAERHVRPRLLVRVFPTQIISRL